MGFLATIDDPSVIHRILTHLGLSTELGEQAPGRAPPGRRWSARRLSTGSGCPSRSLRRVRDATEPPTCRRKWQARALAILDAADAPHSTWSRRWSG